MSWCTGIGTERMRIYFAGSIRGGRDDADIYLELVEELRATIIAEMQAEMASYREQLAELQRLFVMEGMKYNVFPLDDRRAERFTGEDRPGDGTEEEPSGVGVDVDKHRTGTGPGDRAGAGKKSIRTRNDRVAKPDTGAHQCYQQCIRTR